MGDVNGKFTVNLGKGDWMPRDWWDQEPPDDYEDPYPPSHDEDVPQDTTGGPTVADRVFGATPTLSSIRQAAHARLVVPWAVLGTVLARVVAEIPPHVVLPPIVGGDASLNLAVALVAESGGGKSGATSCAADAVHIGRRRAQDIGPGSGEGIMMAFLERDPETKTNVLKAHPLALLSADEIGQIGAVQGRASQSTFGPIMRSMLTGGRVATSAVDEERRRMLAPNTYRLCAVAGVQPKLSDVLLDDSDAGTPQRWLWLPADDPSWDAGRTEWPGAVSWDFPRLPRGDADGRVRLDVPEEVQRLVVEARIKKLRRETDGLDGHRLLTQEKVAAALALLHGECAITMAWWDLAGLVMHVSDATRARCAVALSIKAEAEHKARGRLDAVRESGAREARNAEVERYAQLLHREVSRPTCSKHKHTPEDGHTRVCLTFALRSHRGKGIDVDAIIEAAEALDWITRCEDGRWRPGAAHPAEDVAA